MLWHASCRVAASTGLCAMLKGCWSSSGPSCCGNSSSMQSSRGHQLAQRHVRLSQQQAGLVPLHVGPLPRPAGGRVPAPAVRSEGITHWQSACRCHSRHALEQPLKVTQCCKQNGAGRQIPLHPNPPTCAAPAWPPDASRRQAAPDTGPALFKEGGRRQGMPPHDLLLDCVAVKGGSLHFGLKACQGKTAGHQFPKVCGQLATVNLCRSRRFRCQPLHSGCYCLHACRT